MRLVLGVMRYYILQLDYRFISFSINFVFSSMVCLLLIDICLFGVYQSFHSYGDVTITGEGLQVLTYARHSWQLSGEGSLACHTYCDTGHPFNNCHLRGPVTHTYCRAIGNGDLTTVFMT